MKQEWRLQGKKAEAGFGTPLLWLCLSFPEVLPSPLPGLELAQAGPAWMQGWRGASKAGSSSQSHCGRSRGGTGLHTDLAQVPDSPCAGRTILQWMISHNLISWRVWGLHPGVFPQGHSAGSFFCLSCSRGAGKALVSHWSFPPSLLWPAGPSPALSCPVEWPRRPQDGCSCLTHSPFPFVTEEAALELKFRISPCDPTALNWDLGGQGLQDLPHQAQTISPLLSPTTVIP